MQDVRSEMTYDTHSTSVGIIQSKMISVDGFCRKSGQVAKMVGDEGGSTPRESRVVAKFRGSVRTQFNLAERRHE